MNDKTIEQFRKFKFDFESDNDARPSQLDTWKHQQKRIDELEEQLKIAVEAMNHVMAYTSEMSYQTLNHDCVYIQHYRI